MLKESSMICQLCKELKTRNTYYLVERVKGYSCGIQDNFIKVVKLDNKFYINAKGQGVTAEIKYCPLCGSKLGE